MSLVFQKNSKKHQKNFRHWLDVMGRSRCMIGTFQVLCYWKNLKFNIKNVSIIHAAIKIFTKMTPKNLAVTL